MGQITIKTYAEENSSWREYVDSLPSFFEREKEVVELPETGKDGWIYKVEGTNDFYRFKDDKFEKVETPSIPNKGEKGEKGEPGEKGLDGTSPYDIAVAGGYSGTETEFNLALSNVGDIPSVLNLLNGEEI